MYKFKNHKHFYTIVTKYMQLFLHKIDIRSNLLDLLEVIYRYTK